MFPRRVDGREDGVDWKPVVLGSDVMLREGMRLSKLLGRGNMQWPEVGWGAFRLWSNMAPGIVLAVRADTDAGEFKESNQTITVRYAPIAHRK